MESIIITILCLGLSKIIASLGTYEWLKRWCTALLPAQYMGLAYYVCGGLAFLASSVVLVPGELLKQRLQVGIML